ADGGIDLKLVKDGETWLVQCKRWRQEKVGVKVARELFGVVASERATGGILITAGTFTPEAESFARGKPLRLVTGDELLRMVGAVQKGGDLADAPTAPPSGPASVAPTRSESTAAAPQCPQCGAPMVRRVARQGKSAGRAFWGCSQYPACRGIQSI
ncbi:MAG: restriction endonuclease, partial [Chthonomonas sp.]|nr:restriction endonuclease [Chthonomonas sp.]